MYTTKFIRLHSKSLQILEAIQTVSNRIESCKADIQSFSFLPSTVAHFEERLKVNRAIKNRLVRYYASTFCILSEDVVAKCYPELETA